MPSKKISEFVLASALDEVDLLPVVQGGTTKRATFQQVIDAMSDVFDEFAPSGIELARASGTAIQAGVTTVVDITGLAITFTVTNRPVDVELWLPWVQCLTAASVATAKIADGAGTQTGQVPLSLGISEVGPIRVMESITTPGTYTRKGQIQRGSGTGSITLGAGSATATHFIRAVTR